MKTVRIGEIKVSRHIFEEWLEELREGKHRKAKDRLQGGPNSFCCLGVACNMFIPQQDKTVEEKRLVGEMPSDQPSSPEWLKIIDTDFKMKTGVALTVLNDGESLVELLPSKMVLTHPEIADLLQAVYIEKVLK